MPQQASVVGYSALAEPMIDDVAPTKTSRIPRALAFVPLCLFGCAVLYSQASRAGVPQPATDMIQPLKAQLQRAEVRAFGAAAANLRAAPTPAKVWGYASALHWAAKDGARAGCRGELTCTRAVGLFYSTSTGKTEEAAEMIAGEAGLEQQEISDISSKDLEGYDGIIAGVPTWNTGADEQRSGTAWDDYLDEIRGLSLCGKPVAIFGLGDSVGYGDNFCDALEELHSTFEAAGAKMVGYTPDSGYEYADSKSVKDGKFLGLPLDGDNESDMTEDRVKKWVAQLKSEGMPI